MRFDLSAWLLATRKEFDLFDSIPELRELKEMMRGAGFSFSLLETRPWIVCEDGLELSVQASAYGYCTPRSDDGPYTHVEIGFPTQVLPKLMPYCEDCRDPLDTLYAYVPIELVEEIIEEHGGFAGMMELPDLEEKSKLPSWYDKYDPILSRN